MYQIVYADPPWPTGKGFFGKHVSEHYPLMTETELRAVPVSAMADPAGALLFLWSPGIFLDMAMRLGRAWGFRYITMGFVWDKQRTVLGTYTLSQCEFVLVFRRGTIPKPRGIRNARQLVSELRREHSRKPDSIRETIEKMFPSQRRIELFARTRTPGWDAHGDQVGTFGP